ncbi:hypothetical protein L484_007521 [Morus notabilis]|uniref:Uncharacterized protein n=1 Tax=Morus notabilis TaxID=981085 RepID=W9S2K6_9ROSA|nr:hypothetical protein L484_007521 [Morus notabilis]
MKLHNIRVLGTATPKLVSSGPSACMRSVVARRAGTAAGLAAANYTVCAVLALQCLGWPLQRLYRLVTYFFVSSTSKIV